MIHESICSRRVLTGAALATAAALLVGPAAAQTRKEAPKIGDPPEAMNMRLVGSNDLQGRTAYQPTIVRQGDRYIAYIGHHGGSGEFSKPVSVLTGLVPRPDWLVASLKVPFPLL